MLEILKHRLNKDNDEEKAMNYKEYRFCSNCSLRGSLKYIGHQHDGKYLCRPCWDQVQEVERKMKRSIAPNVTHYDFWYRPTPPLR